MKPSLPVQGCLIQNEALPACCVLVERLRVTSVADFAAWVERQKVTGLFDGLLFFSALEIQRLTSLAELSFAFWELVREMSYLSAYGPSSVVEIHEMLSLPVLGDCRQENFYNT